MFGIGKSEPGKGWRKKLFVVIFGAETKWGRFFDVTLIIAITASVLIVMLDSIASLRMEYGEFFKNSEWFFTILFTIEYVLRIISVKKPRRYIFSFFGVIDLLAIIPTYISLFLPGTEYLIAIRVLRILRVFRVLKLVKYLNEAEYITKALLASRRKILVFLFAVFMIAIFAGSIVYVVEGQENGFTSIPISIYWAIVTLSTVGYGDIIPVTPLGQLVSAVIMIMGYAIIAVPTGIVSYEMARTQRIPIVCSKCKFTDHDFDAEFCKICGSDL
ncbi:MAG: ion transporter [Balneolaceae bacterium]